MPCLSWIRARSSGRHYNNIVLISANWNHTSTYVVCLIRGKKPETHLWIQGNEMQSIVLAIVINTQWCDLMRNGQVTFEKELFELISTFNEWSDTVYDLWSLEVNSLVLGWTKTPLTILAIISNSYCRQLLKNITVNPCTRWSQSY